MKIIEFDALQSVDASIVVSVAEQEILHKELPEIRNFVLPLIMDIHANKQSFENRENIVFVGGYQHAPNVDAVLYFVNEVMPLLRHYLPNIHLYVVGSKPPKEINDLAAHDVIITGFVEDLSSLLNKMRVSIAPLRYGAGIKGKIGSAMATGLPTVATSVAAEGMSLTNDENILLADDPETFASAIARLYEDQDLWNHLSKNGLRFAEKAWGSEAAWTKLSAILEELGLPNTRGKNALKLYSHHF